MARNVGHIGQSEGEKRLHAYCLEVARGLGLEINRVYWAADLPAEVHILTVEIGPDTSTAIPFSRQEIDGYARGIGIPSAHAKVRIKLEDLVEEPDLE